MNFPVRSITSEARFAMVSAFLAKHYTGVVGSDLENPIGTVTGVVHHSLVSCHIEQQNGMSRGVAVDARSGLWRGRARVRCWPAGRERGGSAGGRSLWQTACS